MGKSEFGWKLIIVDAKMNVSMKTSHVCLSGFDGNNHNVGLGKNYFCWENVHF